MPKTAQRETILSAHDAAVARSSKTCGCGAAKWQGAIACGNCWYQLPRALRNRYLNARPGSAERREAERACLTKVRAWANRREVQHA